MNKNEKVELPKEIQAFIDSKNIKFNGLNSLSNHELTQFHAVSHLHSLQIFHKELVKELKIRGRTHQYLDWLDRELEFLIKDWKTYDPMKLINTKQGKRILLDDHRIVHAWMKILKKGKRMKSDQFKDLTLERQKEIVKMLYNKIVKALKKLGWEYSPLFKEVLFKIERKDLEDIDDVFVKKLTDKQLVEVDEQLHKIYKEIEKVTEPLHNAHVFVWKEMNRRRIAHEIEDGLTDSTALEVVEYPTPRGEASKESMRNKPEISGTKGIVTLEQALKAFPDQIVIHDPPQQVHIVGRIVNTGKSPEGHDIDILFKQAKSDPRLIIEFLKVVRRNNPEVAKRLHFVFDVKGPQVGHSIPLYRLSYSKLGGNELVKHSPWEYLKGSVKVGIPIRALKAQTGFKKFEFFNVEDLWHLWAAKRINKGIIIQKKYDGMRFQIHKKGDIIKVITEDRQRDRASVFKKSIAEMLAKVKTDNFVLDTEMVEYNCRGKKIKDKETLCDGMPREAMIPWVVAKKPMDDENIVFHVHDCMIYDNEDITQKGYEERYNFGKKIIGNSLEHWRMVPSFTAQDKKSFEKTVSKIRRWKGSEGAMLKTKDSVYKLTGRTSDWAKIKNVKEIDVMVWDPIPKKTKEGKVIPGQWMYICVFSIPKSMKNEVREKDLVIWKEKTYLKIGKTYSTSVRCKRGDIVTVKPIRIAEFEESGKKWWTWMFPWFSMKHPTKKEPDTIDTVRKLAKKGTAPLTSLSEEIVILKKCPFCEDNEICPLKNRFVGPMDSLTRKKMFLRFPVACQFADYYRCRYVKLYYYGIEKKNGREEIIEYEVELD